MIKNRLREIRLKLAAQQGKDIPQADMARFLDVNVTQYNRFENQQVQPSLETAYRIAKKLGYIMEEIFYIDE
jgi:DNA-binding XRE family transcriptional regulator